MNCSDSDNEVIRTKSGNTATNISEYTPSDDDMRLFEDFKSEHSLDDNDDLGVNGAALGAFLRRLPMLSRFHKPMREECSAWYERYEKLYPDRKARDLHRKWYIVCKPYDLNYKANPKLFQKNCFDYLRKYFGFTKDSIYFMTKEVNAAKTHVNIFYIQTEDETDMHQYDMSENDDHKTKNYFYCVQEANSLLDVCFILDYIIKESWYRKFNLYSDYICSPSVLAVPADK